jgi:hypothetical protein
MKCAESHIKLFQSSSFRVDNIGAFLANKDVQHVIRVMDFYELPSRSHGDRFAISLPPEAFHVSIFDDDLNKVDMLHLLAVVDAIETHIAEDDVCNFTYINLKRNAFANTFRGVIKRGEVTSGISSYSSIADTTA